MESNNPFMRNVITTLHMVLLTSMYLYLHLIIEKFGIIKTQTLKVFKKQFQILIGLKHLGTRTQMKVVNYWRIYQWIFLENISLHKTKKSDCKTPEWMNTLIISALKKSSILVTRYCRNPSGYNKEALINQSNECTKLITEGKQNFIAKMSSKLDCPDTASKTYWAIINRFLCKKRYQIYRLTLLTANSYRIFIKKQCTLIQHTSTLPVFNFKTNNRLKSFDIN